MIQESFKHLHQPCKRAEATCHGNESRHFPQAQHGNEDNRSHNQVRDQYGGWTAGGKRFARSQKETCRDQRVCSQGLYYNWSIATGSNRSANSNHLDLTS